MSRPARKPRAARATYPKHVVTHEVVDVALEASDRVFARAMGWLDVLCELRETLRLQRSDDRALGREVRAAGGVHRYLTKADQYRFISERAAHDLALRAVHSQVRQNVADRIDAGTKRWLSGNAGPLRQMPRKKYRSFTFTQYGFAVKIRSGRLHMSGLGEARLVGLRRLPGRVKSVTITFKQGRLFAQFTCEVQRQHCPRAARNASGAVQQLPDTGLDTGLARVATLADGIAFAPAKPLKKALARLKREQQAMSRKFEARKRDFEGYCRRFKELELHGPLPKKSALPLSNRLKAQIRCVAKIHTRIENTRRDSLRKTARRIERNYRCVAVEEHGLRFMQRSRRTSRAVSDVAPGLFKSLLKQALGEERYLPVANRRPDVGGNSQSCLCGAVVPKQVQDRWHLCPACGLSADRDTVSANIAMLLAFGYSNLGAVRPPEPGQGFVRRGEGKDQPGQPAVASLKGGRASGEASILERTTADTQHDGCASYRRSRKPAGLGERKLVLTG